MMQETTLKPIINSLHERIATLERLFTDIQNALPIMRKDIKNHEARLCALEKRVRSLEPYVYEANAE